LILFVCEGNVCRSVLAAALFRAADPLPDSGVEVRDAGINALVGEPADPITAGIGRRLGVDLSAHRAHQVTTEEIAEASLILTATKAIRSQIVQTYAPAIRYSYSIRQVGRVLAHSAHTFDPAAWGHVEALTAFVQFVNQERGPVGRGPGADDDIIDPYGQPVRVHEIAAQQIVSSIGLLSDAFQGSRIAWVPAS